MKFFKCKCGLGKITEDYIVMTICPGCLEEMKEDKNYFLNKKLKEGEKNG